MSFSFGAAVRLLLLGDADLTAQLPGGIHPDSIPQEAAFPAMAYSVASEPFTSITGQSAIRFATMEIKVVAVTAAQLRAIDKAIDGVISTNSGRVTRAGVSVCALRYGGMNASIEDLGDGDDEPYRELEATITGVSDSV
jgi:hypothetical protein